MKTMVKIRLTKIEICKTVLDQFSNLGNLIASLQLIFK